MVQVPHNTPLLTEMFSNAIKASTISYSGNGPIQKQFPQTASQRAPENGQQMAGQTEKSLIQLRQEENGLFSRASGSRL
jgi:hypothetical protein